MAIDCQNIKHTYCCVRGLRTQILKIKGKKRVVASTISHQMAQNLTFNRQKGWIFAVSLQINSSVLTVNRLEGWKKFYKIPHPLKPWRKIQTTDTWSWPWGNDQILKKNISIKERKKLVVYHSLTKLRTPKAWILIMKKKVVKFLSGVGQNIKTFPRTWEKPADYLKHLQVLKKTIFHLSRAWDEYQALFIEIRGTFSTICNQKLFFNDSWPSLLWHSTRS